VINVPYRRDEARAAAAVAADQPHPAGTLVPADDSLPADPKAGGRS
jgi:hypothetical protein